MLKRQCLSFVSKHIQKQDKFPLNMFTFFHLLLVRFKYALAIVNIMLNFIHNLLEVNQSLEISY